MVDYGESLKVAQAMQNYGGGFICALGLALMKADAVNRQKVKDAFPEYWQEYLKKSEKMQ